MYLGVDEEVLVAVDIAPDARFLRHVAYDFPDLGTFSNDIQPENMRFTGRRFELGRQNAHERRLARAVGSKQRKDVAGLDVQVEPASAVTLPL